MSLSGRSSVPTVFVYPAVVVSPVGTRVGLISVFVSFGVVVFQPIELAVLSSGQLIRPTPLIGDDCRSDLRVLGVGR